MPRLWRAQGARLLPWTLLLAAVALACATVPPPSDTVNAAGIKIDEATRAGAEPHARLELHMARENLAKAKVAMEAEENDKARELAEKALVEAELAEAKAESAEARNNVAEIRTHIQTLRQEIDRASGGSR